MARDPMSSQELHDAILSTLGHCAAGISVDGIAEAIRSEYGPIVSLDDVPEEDYWEIVRAYDGTDL